MQTTAQEYREEDDDHPTPRPEGSYRLPPLQFGEPSPQASDHSAPRSLTPITERTDIASRTNSTRTAKSNFLVNERQPSGSSSMKQKSAGSMKHVSAASAGQEDRLAPISDSTEGHGQMIEEPVDDSTPMQEVLEPPTPPDVTPTTAESGGTLPTTWSRSTGETPTELPSSTNSPIRMQPQQVPVPTRTSPLPGPEYDLPDAPSTISTTGPLLGGVIGSAMRSEPRVLSPTPRRVSGELSPTGSPLHDEPAAMYLMNMVEREPHSSPQQASSSRLDPPTDRSRPTIVTSLDSSNHLKHTSDNLGRKPSGARAPPPKKTSGPRPLEAIGDEGNQQSFPSSSTQADLGEDVSAYVAYADQPSPAKPFLQQQTSAPPPVQEDDLRSSFALSKSAAERRAKAEQAAADQQRAMNIPGGGKRNAAGDTWSGSEDEEEDDESPIVQTRPTVPPQPHPRQPSPSPPPPPPVQRVLSQSRALPAIPRAPEIRMPNGDDQRQSMYQPSQTYDRPRSRSPAQAQQPSAPNRQNVWNASFSADHGMAENKSGKFVELEEHSAQLTKAFAPHGLLQAGIQDKEDRSAKKQEEVAREMGSSLISVPSKPPPPQMGLLGAVAAHERDRKNAGGIGATLTDRERERRQAVSFSDLEGTPADLRRRSDRGRWKKFNVSRWSR